MADRPLRLTVDARSLSDASAARGIGTYVRSLLAELADRPGLAVTALTVGEPALPPGVAASPVRRVLPPRLSNLEHRARLTGDLRRVPADVVHAPALELPRRSPAPLVATVYDTTPLSFPDPALAADARRLHRAAPRYRSAAVVVAISESTKRDAVRHLGLDPDRVVVAHLAAGAPYVLYVGEHGPHKGYAEAFAVAGALADAGLPHRLRVAGRLAPWVEPTVRALVAAAPRPDRVELLGYVDDLPALYRGASALVGTSRYEGFGLPALEAMACGVPVVAFANSATTEVVDGGGTLVADGDVGALASALRAVLADEALAADMRGRALQRAGAFSWRATADAHVEAYRRAASAADRPSPPPDRRATR